ncbi:pyridoxal-phosphate dependent enzyme [Allokutzneria sp. A3M-2-11 16]|uniref:threonine ammonia-lyase n=1 Tax=Allokutzneria sp. A3M-2-11 16 TaxID=2962043 RepID=UPI0020B6AA13|nr:pyridoxal-phosphate dependent enzyme [Allokutzneria sp. A3M-2-11 16]MCP3802980.1 pyridoxal-phosphate dependent enzyme [Allokutzneria sp. A3M-2-11 16]
MSTPALDLAGIERASKEIDPVFRDSPQFVEESLSARLGRQVLVKLETANPLRCFKGRGADTFAARVSPDVELVCGSAGNFGQALGYVGRARGIPVRVHVGEDINPDKLARMRALGANVVVSGPDCDGAKDHARAYAAEAPGRLFVEEGAESAIAEGNGSIGVELLAAGGFDTVVVPVGDGALITGVATWIKHHSPRTRVVGVCAAGAPAPERSWRAGAAVATDSVDTIADGIALRRPVMDAVNRMRTLVDDMVLVSESALLNAMGLAAHTVGVLLEPAGAAPLAALTEHEIPGDRVAIILTGANPRPEHVRAALLTT